MEFRHDRTGSQSRDAKHTALTQAQAITITDDMTLRDLARMLHLSTTDLDAKLAVLGEVTESVEDMCGSI